MKGQKPFTRTRFPEDEKRYPWLTLLLEAYSVIDKGVAFALKEEQKRRGVILACKRGCSSCCNTHHDIPVYPLEIAGIQWFVLEKMEDARRTALKQGLLEHRTGGGCPFLLDHICSIHPLRPIACRQFNVFNRPCAEGEDPYYTRRDDVLIPDQAYADRAFSIMLPFYGITDKKVQDEVIRTRLIHTMARVLQGCDWRELAGKIERLQAQKG